MEQQQKEKRNWRKIGGIAVLTLFLVVFPLVSWYYLKGGMEYRMKALEELEELAELKEFSLRAYDQLLTRKDMHGRTAVVSFLSDDPAQRQAVCDQVLKLHEQFDERNDLLFLSYYPVPSGVEIDLLSEAAKLGIKDTDQWLLLAYPPSFMANHAAEHYGLEESAQEPELHLRRMALVDTSGTTRHYYDPMNNDEMGRLVEHIALVLPRLPEPDIEFKREKEK